MKTIKANKLLIVFVFQFFLYPEGKFFFFADNLTNTSESLKQKYHRKTTHNDLTHKKLRYRQRNKMNKTRQSIR